MNVLITGGSGMIGTRLTELLIQAGHQVSHLGRTKRSGGLNSFVWNVDRHEIDPRAFDNIDAIVHLAGAGIGDKRWTKKRKNEILDSRVNSTRLLHDELKTRNHAVRTFVAASAMGYYGFENPQEVFTEDSAPGKDFLAQVTDRWEREADTLNDLGLRLVKVRTGHVLSNDGGVLKELLRPIMLYAGAPLGSGNQFLSWIHIDDFCKMCLYILQEEKMHGVYNAAAPNPVSNKNLILEIARKKNKNFFITMRVPSFVLKTVLGEMSVEILKSTTVSTGKIQGMGFQFTYPSIEEAIDQLTTR